MTMGLVMVVLVLTQATGDIIPPSIAFQFTSLSLSLWPPSAQHDVLPSPAYCAGVCDWLWIYSKASQGH